MNLPVQVHFNCQCTTVIVYLWKSTFNYWIEVSCIYMLIWGENKTWTCKACRLFFIVGIVLNGRVLRQYSFKWILVGSCLDYQVSGIYSPWNDWMNISYRAECQCRPFVDNGGISEQLVVTRQWNLWPDHHFCLFLRSRKFGGYLCLNASLLLCKSKFIRRKQCLDLYDLYWCLYTKVNGQEMYDEIYTPGSCVCAEIKAQRRNNNWISE